MTDPNAAQMGTLYLSATNALADVWKDQVKGAYVVIPGFTNWSSAVAISNAIIGLPDGFAFNATSVQLGTNSGLILGDNQTLSYADFTLPTNGLLRVGSNSRFACSGNLSLQGNAKLRMLTNAVLTCGGAVALASNAALTLYDNSSMICTGSIGLTNSALLNFYANSSLTCTGGISVLGGAGTTLQFGTNSSLTCGGDLFVNQGQLTMSTNPLLNCAGNLTLTNGAKLTVYSGPTNESAIYGGYVNVTNDLTICPSSWIYPYAHSSNGGAVKFTVKNLYVSGGTNAGFNADQKGYAGGSSSANGYGPGAGKGAGGNWASGAGYGGKGGASAFVGPGISCGSSHAPIAPGSGGGSGGAAPPPNGGNGGGAVEIKASEAIVLDGLLTANGGDGSPRNGTLSGGSGAGSGGAVFMVCQTFRGGAAAIVRANGGNGAVSLSGAGGGGLITVWIGLSPSQQARARIGELSRLKMATSYTNYSGIFSALNGTGLYNPPLSGSAEPGTILILTPKKGALISF